MRKFYCRPRGCDSFSYVEDEKSHRLPIYTTNNTPFHSTGIS